MLISSTASFVTDIWNNNNNNKDPSYVHLHDLTDQLYAW